MTLAWKGLVSRKHCYFCVENSGLYIRQSVKSWRQRRLSEREEWRGRQRPAPARLCSFTFLPLFPVPRLHSSVALPSKWPLFLPAPLQKAGLGSAGLQRMTKRKRTQGAGAWEASDSLYLDSKDRNKIEQRRLGEWWEKWERSQERAGLCERRMENTTGFGENQKPMTWKELSTLRSPGQKRGYRGLGSNWVEHLQGTSRTALINRDKSKKFQDSLKSKNKHSLLY